MHLRQGGGTRRRRPECRDLKPSRIGSKGRSLRTFNLHLHPWGSGPCMQRWIQAWSFLGLFFDDVCGLSGITLRTSDQSTPRLRLQRRRPRLLSRVIPSSPPRSHSPRRRRIRLQYNLPASGLPVAAAHQRPMAGVPPSVRGASVSGGTNPHPAPVMGVTSTPSRPPAQTPGFSSSPLLQRGPAPVYNYGGNQPPSYGQARHYAPPYGPAVAGAPGSTYRTSPAGMSVPSQFHPGGIVALPVQNRKK